MSPDRRAAPREPLELPVQLGDGSIAVTRDISTRGLYIFIDKDASLSRALQLELTTATLKAKVNADVIRVEPGHFRTGVALRIHRVKLV